MSDKALSFGLFGLVAGTFLTGALQFVFAWTAPTAIPPGGNVATPINVGPVTQTKFEGDICVSIRGALTCLSEAVGSATPPTGSATFSNPGPFSFTVPPRVTSITVEVWGAGGGSGPAAYSYNYNNSVAWNVGGGGGGSGYKTTQTISVTPGQVITGFIGTGGMGGSPYRVGNPPPQIYGGAGQASSFGGLVAAGGSGGRNYNGRSFIGQANGLVFCDEPGYEYYAPGGNPGQNCAEQPGTASIPGTAGGAAVASSFPGVTGGGAGGGPTQPMSSGLPGENGKVYIKW